MEPYYAPQSTLMDETTIKLLDPDRISRSEANAMESLDYDLIDSKVYLEQKQKKSSLYRVLLNIQLWFVTFLIGFVIGIFGVGMDWATKKIIFYKIELANKAYDACSDCFWFPYVVVLLANVFLSAAAAGMVVLIAPAGGGSGIPEVKCYLNGIKVPEILRMRTLFVKAIGTIFTVSGGLACGNEGPMIHIGSMVAAGISQGKSSTIPFLNTPLFSEFRNDHDKRDFVSGGAAAGVAGAFGAPVGGTLFSLEEGSSFWNQALTWRTFFCAIVASFTLNTFLSGIRNNGWSPDDTSPSFEITDNDSESIYKIPHVPFFILIGVMGGLLGAVFNKINLKIMLLRKRYLFQHRFLRWIEVIVIAAITSSVSLSMTYFFKQCQTDMGPDDENFNYTTWFCGPNSKNDMSTLYLGTGEIAVKNLLRDDLKESSFSNVTLIAYTISYFCLACITLGIAAPSGLLVPCLAIGGAYGRLIGQFLKTYGIVHDANYHTFTLVGAASFLGGSARMTISLCVILIETTGSVARGLPIMLTLMIAKWVGDLFSHGIYDIHINLKNIPLLEWDPDHPMSSVSAEQIMNEHVVSFYEVEKVGKIHIVLQRSTHNGFPIISKAGILQGLILRSQLVTLLHLRVFQPTPDTKQATDIDLTEFTRYYPRFPGIDTVRVQPEDRAKYINLTPYMNLTPFLIQKNATVERVFRLFRTMGLRHLPVIDERAKVVGVITRRDLVYYKQKMERRKNQTDLNTMRNIQDDIDSPSKEQDSEAQEDSEQTQNTVTLPSLSGTNYNSTTQGTHKYTRV